MLRNGTKVSLFRISDVMTEIWIGFHSSLRSVMGSELFCVTARHAAVPLRYCAARSSSTACIRSCHPLRAREAWSHARSEMLLFKATSGQWWIMLTSAVYSVMIIINPMLIIIIVTLIIKVIGNRWFVLRLKQNFNRAQGTTTRIVTNSHKLKEIVRITEFICVTFKGNEIVWNFQVLVRRRQDTDWGTMNANVANSNKSVMPTGPVNTRTVIPRLTSDPTNEFFG